MERHKNLSIIFALALVIVFFVGIVAPAEAVVLDPVAWLYPIWVAYGQQAGVTITTMGGDQFTQGAFSGLFQEWQQSRVSAGLQQAVITLSDFVNASLNFASVTSGSVSGGVLNTVLQLDKGLVKPLAQFWNWVIKDKLGGSQYDAVDFDQTTGNLGSATVEGYLPFLISPTIDQAKMMFYYNGYYWYAACKTSDRVYAFLVGGTLYFFSDTATQVVVRFRKQRTGSSVYEDQYTLTASRSYPGYYSSSISIGGVSYSQIGIPVYSSIDDALGVYDPDYVVAGSLTVAPDAGVDVLGFPDASNPDYDATDTNIGWNVAYDPTLDTTGYLDAAYDMAIGNNLLDQTIDNSEVIGSDVVGNAGQYVSPGLASVFPFCIPFDIYNFLSALAADPVPPHFTATLQFPAALGGNQTIDIDFDSPTWNQLAQILRLLELLAFIVGLAFVTRSMFIRG